MTILLTILSLLVSGECRVHRNPDTNEPGFGRNCIILGTVVGQDTCFVDSHWVDTCKADTLWYGSTLGLDGKPYPPHMVVKHPNGRVDTTLFTGCIAADRNYLPVDTCAVKLRTVCDTTYEWTQAALNDWTGKNLSTYMIVKCHEDTIKADTLSMPTIRNSTMPINAFQTEQWGSGVPKSGRISSTVEPDSLYPTQFTAEEIRVLREMIREYQIEKCFQQARDWKNMWMIWEGEQDAVRDSCRCVYGWKEK